MDKTPPGLPTREQILAFITTSDTPAGKREIARAFGLNGAEKIALKALLRDMGDEGLIDAAPGRAFHEMGGVPKVTVLRVADVDDGGNVWAVPERWDAETRAPKLRVRERKRGALGVGDRILARTEEAGAGLIAHPMKLLPKGEELMLGVLRQEGERLWLQGVDKRERREWAVSDAGGAEAGDLVLAEKAGRPPRVTARVTQRLGDPFQPRSFSLIAIHKFGIPEVFSAEALAEAERVAGLPFASFDPPRASLGEGGHAEHGGGVAVQAASPASAPPPPPPAAVAPLPEQVRGGSGREDLRHLPIIAIDPADARDHDDAVWAAPDDDPANAGGWRALVAIADVAFYVRPGSELDREARRRGNSVYFPDRVVPMLPELLSADVCSLKEGADRAALVCHLQVGKTGDLKSWRFARAVVRIAANIAYEDAQAAIDQIFPLHGEGDHAQHGGGAVAPDEAPPESPLHHSPLASGPPPRAGEELRPILAPLWACWRALAAARRARAPLDLDLPERRVVLDEKGRILSVAPRERLDSMRLIEDYMIAANVAAAKALERKQAPVMYRVHEPPSREKLVALKEYLATFDVAFALGQVIRPATFNHVIERIGDAAFRPQVMEQILRTQTQAYYAPANHGHFGLALGSYAHFTSPIRRYADLLVHRSLAAAYDLGEGGLSSGEAGAMDVIGESISKLERRAMEAERDTVDRYVAAFLSERIGELVEGRVTGVTNFGLFVTVEGVGGDGLLAIRDLGTEYFRYDEAAKKLVGDTSGEEYTLGQRLQLRLAEANPVSGALRFELPEGAGGAMPGRARSPGDGRGREIKRRGRPANIRHQGRKR